MLDGDLSGCQDGLQGGDIQPEEGHDEGEQHGGEEVVILRLLVEEWGVLEDGETPGTDC